MFVYMISTFNLTVRKMGY